MSNNYYTSPVDVEALTKVRSIDINTIDAAIDTAFDKLPSETNLKQGKVNYAVDTGAADAYIVSLPHAPASYADGLLVSFRPTNTNTGASTINVNGLGVKSIKLLNGNDLVAGDITANGPTSIRYNSTTGYFYMSANSSVAAAAAATSATAAAASATAAASSASSASSSASAASTSATNAANSAASINMPSMVGRALNILRANAGETEHEYRTPTQVRSDIAAAALTSNIFTGNQTLSGAAINEAKGVGIASAATVDLDAATGNLVHITGTTTITAITLASGAARDVVFDDALTLTHHATTLILPGAANITTAAGDRATFRGDGTGNVRCMNYVRASGVAIVTAARQYLHVRDEKANGTLGGASSAGNNDRTLNTVVSNSITGASLASNLVNLPAGTYDFLASAPSFQGGRSKLTLYNNTDSADLMIGGNEFADGPESTAVRATCSGRFVLSAAKDVKLRHYIQLAKADNGLGLAASSGQVEVFASLQIWKEA